jgi:phosphopentomutase
LLNNDQSNHSHEEDDIMHNYACGLSMSDHFNLPTITITFHTRKITHLVITSKVIGVVYCRYTKFLSSNL